MSVEEPTDDRVLVFAFNFLCEVGVPSDLKDDCYFLYEALLSTLPTYAEDTDVYVSIVFLGYFFSFDDLQRLWAGYLYTSEYYELHNMMVPYAPDAGDQVIIMHPSLVSANDDRLSWVSQDCRFEAIVVVAN